MELTDAVLHELSYLAEQATAGEWEAVNNGALYGVVRIKGTNSQIAACTMPDDTWRSIPPMEANSLYIAAAQPAVVLAMVERLARLEHLVKASKQLVLAEADGSPTRAFSDAIDWVIKEAKDLG
ncbi:hypothetical protein OB934_18585 [Aeromonas salmonicida]|uniref:hypothetical protein n=1 Tax=Aeromonas salmonicida TaxID=645 RepID=UPI001F315960|nr:hypothetical protein [Aeromonas salmonicida]MCE9935637.1 hypothetical protein [Aeromonas salmonicida]MDM5064797.1 hypothetical protein [Aeromonas salmonicida]HDO1193149.1 hypothetical protein [Aeromonas salmonicida]